MTQYPVPYKKSHTIESFSEAKDEQARKKTLSSYHETLTTSTKSAVTHFSFEFTSPP
jgi:hypothetical protein